MFSVPSSPWERTPPNGRKPAEGEGQTVGENRRCQMLTVRRWEMGGRGGHNMDWTVCVGMRA